MANDIIAPAGSVVIPKWAVLLVCALATLITTFFLPWAYSVMKSLEDSRESLIRIDARLQSMTITSTRLRDEFDDLEQRVRALEQRL